MACENYFLIGKWVAPGQMGQIQLHNQLVRQLPDIHPQDVFS